MYNTYYPDYLMHYGVKGMKWGVRRYQKKDGSLTDAGKERYSETSNSKKAKEDPDKVDDSQSKEKRKLTRKQKAVLIGASVVAVYATYKFIDSGNATRLIEKGKAALGKDVSFKQNSELARKDFSADDIMSKVVSRINPEYGQLGTKMNCKRCTYAYEMSRRGFDVKATRSIGATGQTTFGTFNATHIEQTSKFKYSLDLLRDKQSAFDIETDKNLARTKMRNKYLNGEPGQREYSKYLKARGATKKIDDLAADLMGETISKKSDSYTKDIFKAIAKQPNGARGELTIKYRVKGLNMDLGGHSVAWEMVNNHPVIFDCQTGKKHNIASFEKDFGSLLYGASLTRLDNKPLNEDFLRRWLQNA